MRKHTREQLWIELRHLQSQLSTSPLGAGLGLCERAWSRGQELAARHGFVVRLYAEAVRWDLGSLTERLERARRVLAPGRTRART
jgi:hypothetical protein